MKFITPGVSEIWVPEGIIIVVTRQYSVREGRVWSEIQMRGDY
jgi:hypothetical protein